MQKKIRLVSFNTKKASLTWVIGTKMNAFDMINDMFIVVSSFNTLNNLHPFYRRFEGMPLERDCLL